MVWPDAWPDSVLEVAVLQWYIRCLLDADMQQVFSISASFLAAVKVHTDVDIITYQQALYY